MTEIKVSFAALEAARAAVAGAAARVSGQLRALRRFLGPLVTGWEGQAAAQYQAKQRQWDSAAADLAGVLAQIGVALGAAHDGYRRVEQLNAARWR